MSTPLVLTVIARDAPGIVERIADTVASHDGNWLESRMARLAGEFAGIVRVSAPEERVEGLTAALQGLDRAGLRIQVARGAGSEPAADTRALRMELVGHDRPGIVREISQALAAHGVNVEELETDTSSAPMSGETLFHAAAQLRLPPDLDTEALGEELEKIAHDLMVDVQLDEGE